MKTSELNRVRRTAMPWPSALGDQAGAAMMYILLVTGVIAVVTVAILMVISADLSAGIRQMQGVRVFNLAEGGIHYAIARLQETGAETYPGETISITDGATVLGTTIVTVGCIDASALPCSGANAAYRRIVSTATLPESGPSRTIVAVVEGSSSGGGSYAVCGYDAVVVNQGITIYGDIGANGSITLSGPSSSYARVRADPPPPYTNEGHYTGSARAVGAISCSQGCTTQVQGTTTPFDPGPVCATPTLPAFAPGTTDYTVTTDGWTMDAHTGYDWDEINVAAAGHAGGCTGETPFSDLRIQTGAAGTTTVVNLRTLTLGRCGRVILLGAGNVDLRIGEASGQALIMGQYTRFGVLPSDTVATPAPVPAGRLTVNIRSTAMDPNPNAVQIDRGSIVSANFIVPNGEWDADQTGNVYGAVLGRRVDIDQDLVFTYDPTVSGTPTYSDFTRLRSWKDQ